MTRQNWRACITPTNCQGSPLLAIVPYSIAKFAPWGYPSHPLDLPAFPYWAADYWATLGTSGVLTAGMAVLLSLWAPENSAVPPTTACLVGLAYGLATPAYVYATLGLRPPGLGICSLPRRSCYCREKTAPCAIVSPGPRRVSGRLCSRDRASGRSRFGDSAATC